MMSIVQVVLDPWLELSEAAELLGVHFTTLRRWADNGKVPCIRTPGGRRRFKRTELLAFLDSLRHGEMVERLKPAMLAPPLPAGPVPRIGMSGETWYAKFDEAQRLVLRNEGQQMMAVLMQYATRSNGGEVFLQEGRRLAADYGITCYKAGLSLVETARAFVHVRRSIMDSVYEAGALAGSPDAETWRLYDRMNNFLDNMLLATLEVFDRASTMLLE